MKVNCPNCDQVYDVDESWCGSRVECQNCHKEFAIPSVCLPGGSHDTVNLPAWKTNLVWWIFVLILIMFGGVVLFLMFPTIGSQSGTTGQEALLWKFVCEETLPHLARPKKSSFARSPEELKSIGNDWYVITGEVETIDTMGKDIAPLIIAKLKFYKHDSKIDPLEDMPASHYVTDTVGNRWMLESLSLGPHTIVDNTERNKSLKEALK